MLILRPTWILTDRLIPTTYLMMHLGIILFLTQAVKTCYFPVYYTVYNIESDASRIESAHCTSNATIIPAPSCHRLLFILVLQTLLNQSSLESVWMKLLYLLLLVYYNGACTCKPFMFLKIC